jgi:hypothetical protein
MAERAGAATFRSIEELAALCGHYCWVERRLFELTGNRASAPASGVSGSGDLGAGDRGAGDRGAGDPEPVDAEVRVVLSQMSARHGFFAAQWRDRLPVRAGVDPEAFITAPAGPAGEALDLIESEPGLAPVLGGLGLYFLPRLLKSYERNLAQASPVSEAPVRAVLEWAAHSTGSELRKTGLLLDRLAPAVERAGSGENFATRLHRLLGPGTETFPGARAS